MLTIHSDRRKHPSAAPITYLEAGTQYIVLAIGGGDATEQLIALALP